MEKSGLTRRIIVAVFGFSVLFVGVLMIVLPGPAFIVIPLGLFILAAEFLWAKRLLKTAKEHIGKITKRKSAK
jgi:tellurite resistance protein TerC